MLRPDKISKKLNDIILAYELKTNIKAVMKHSVIDIMYLEGPVTPQLGNNVFLNRLLSFEVCKIY